jgi:hypothetical protein
LKKPGCARSREEREGKAITLDFSKPYFFAASREKVAASVLCILNGV